MNRNEQRKRLIRRLMGIFRAHRDRNAELLEKVNALKERLRKTEIVARDESFWKLEAVAELKDAIGQERFIEWYQSVCDKQIGEIQMEQKK